MRNASQADRGELRDRVLAALPDTRLVNHYGPTETMVFATSWNPTEDDGGVVPIGTPVGGVLTYVLDDEMCPVQEGQAASSTSAAPDWRPDT